jgi:hypothetical protein
MKGIQNNNYISESIYHTHFWVTQLQRETIRVFSEYMTFSVNFSMAFLGGMTNVQMIFDLVPCCFKHLWWYCSHRVPYVCFQMLKVIDHSLVDSVLHITPQKKSGGDKSGNLLGQVIGQRTVEHGICV